MQSILTANSMVLKLQEQIVNWHKICVSLSAAVEEFTGVHFSLLWLTKWNGSCRVWISLFYTVSVEAIFHCRKNYHTSCQWAENRSHLPMTGHLDQIIIDSVLERRISSSPECIGPDCLMCSYISELSIPFSVACIIPAFIDAALKISCCGKQH